MREKFEPTWRMAASGRTWLHHHLALATERQVVSNFKPEDMTT